VYSLDFLFDVFLSYLLIRGFFKQSFVPYGFCSLNAFFSIKLIKISDDGMGYESFVLNH